MHDRKPTSRPAPFVQPVPVVHKSGLHMTAQVRDVMPVENTLAVYKDLNLNTEMQLRKQKQQLLFAFSFFLLTGLLILMAQVINKPRTIASNDVNFKVMAEPTPVEH